MTKNANGREHRVAVLSEPSDIADLIALLETISAEQGWKPGSQLGAYAASGVHFAAYVCGRLAGGLQLAPASPSVRLPCEIVWPDVPLPNRTRTAHISIMAVQREFRGTAALMWPLCAAMWRYCAANAVADITLEVTPGTKRLYERLGWPLEVIGELRPHWGEECFLCRMTTTAVAGAMLVKAVRSPRYEAIVRTMCQPLCG